MIPACTMSGHSVCLVTNDSNKPATINSGMVEPMIISARIAAICKASDRLIVLGKNKLLPNIIPAAPATIIDDISIVPWIQMVKKDSKNNSFS